MVSETEGIPADVPFTPAPSQVDGMESEIEALDNNGDGPYAMYYRPDARIWRLYLEEAETESKELTTIWKSGLDSLLLFVSQTNTETPFIPTLSALGGSIRRGSHRFHSSK